MDSKFEVVISGISGQFPECENVPSFKEALYEEKSLISLRNDRWPTNYKYQYTDEGLPAATGKFKYFKEIDVAVFKMNHALAECVNVANRKVLEPAFEAIMDAGINPHNLNGRNIGVYMANHNCDTDLNATSLQEGRLWLLGSSKTMMSNRISFAFGLTGPSFTTYADLHGSFMVLNEAYNNIRQGHIEAAIVGVVSTVLSPTFGIQIARMNVLSKDGLTRVFDKNADGYGRSDAVVLLYLQKAEDAKRIYSTIDFSGYSYYGSNPNSFLAYGEDILKRSLLGIYSQADYKDYEDVCFVEMNGCGLKKNDKVECNVIAEVLCKTRKTPLLVGSVKSNVGNTGGSSPYVGLIKAIFALETGIIPHNINLEQIDDDIEAFADNKLQVVKTPTSLPSNKIAVNSLGISGCLSQVILKQNQRTEKIEEHATDNLPRLVLICGRTEDGALNAIRELEQTSFDLNFISLMNDVFSTDMPFHAHRGYTILSPDVERTKKNALGVKGNVNRPIWFLFAGMGSQWNTMGNGLLDVPIFAETMLKCHEILKPKGIDIYHIITTEDPSIFDNITHAFVGIITIQIGLVEILKTLGIIADGIIGHSAGETACAYADGCLTLEEAVLSSYARGIASTETKTIKGMMAAVGKGYNQIKDTLPPNIQVACHNSATSCTLSGPAEEVEKFVSELQEQKVFARTVNAANIAYHSQCVAPAAPNLLARLKEVIPTPIERSSKWVSTSIPEHDWNTPLAKYCSAEYLTNNLISPVLFEESCKHIPSDALVIEIAPHGLLQAILKRSLPETCTNVSLTRRNDQGKNVENLLSAIGELYISGCNVNVNAIYPPIQYPVPRNTPSLAPFATWHHSTPDGGIYEFDLVGSHTGDPIVVQINDDSSYFYLKYHQMNNQIIIPTSFFLYLTWWIFSENNNEKLGSTQIIFENIHLFKNINISINKPRTFTFYIQPGSGKFEILKLSKTDEYKTTKVMTGVISHDDALEHKVNKNRIHTTKYTITREQFYNFFNNVGYQLEDMFCGLQHLTYNEIDSYGTIQWNNNWVSFIDSMLKISTYHDMQKQKRLMYPKKIRKLEITPFAIQSLDKGSTLSCHRNIHTNEIICDGMLIAGVENDYFVDTHSQVKLEGLRFVSHQNPRCQNVSEFLKICFQIAYDDVAGTGKRNNLKLDVVEEAIEKDISKAIKSVVKECQLLKSKVAFWKPKDVLSDKHFSVNKNLLIVTNNFDDARKYAATSFVLLISTSNDLVANNDLKKTLVEITNQQFVKNSISLYKKNLLVDGGKLQVYVDNEKCTNKYVSAPQKAESTFIIKKNTDFEDLSLLLIEKKQPTNHRYIFIMSEAIPNDTILAKPIAQNLPVIVWQNGEWGSYRQVLEENLGQNNKTKQISNLSTNIQLESIQILYLNNDNQIAVENEICKYGIEYAGLHHSGERVIGLSLINTFEPVIKPDKNLTWKVPKNWSMEDAATIPFTYANAYNILDLPPKKPTASNILINVGSEGLLAMACISISLQRNNIVYVTASSDLQADIIRKKFPQINSSHIFNQQITNYEVEVLKATKGIGAHVVINCLPGFQHVRAMLNCAAEFCFCIQIADVNELELCQLELMPFLKSVSFVIVPNKISTLLKLADTDKIRLQAYVQEGIETGIVVPFEQSVQIHGMPEPTDESEERNFIKTIHKFTSQKKSCNNSGQRIRYDSNHSYIIVGGEEKNTSWFELVEWLITKGAQKFIIVVDNSLVGSKISHQINRLINQKKATIILTSSQKVESTQDAVRLVDKAENVAPLEAIFFVSVESAGEKIRNMDLATRQNHPYVHFVSIFSGGLKECESRRYEGSPALVIHGKRRPEKLSTILPHIDDVLSKFDNSNSPTLYRVIDEDLDSNDKKIDISVLRNYLPSDIAALESIGGDLTEDARFVEVATSTAKFADIKNTTPVFVISALGPKPLQGLLVNLLSPAFCAVITNSDGSIAEAASKLYKALNAIQNQGGVTLIAETWWSCVAIEITRLLELDDRKYRLITIEGNPSLWKDRIKTFGPIDSPQFENDLITQVFHSNPKTEGYNVLNSSESLPDRINDYLAAQNYSPLNAHHLANVINTIRNGLVLASQYEDNKNELIKHTVDLAQRVVPDDRITRLSLTSETFVHNEENYYKFIRSPNVFHKINDSIIHNLWYIKE